MCSYNWPQWFRKNVSSKLLGWKNGSQQRLLIGRTNWSQWPRNQWRRFRLIWSICIARRYFDSYDDTQGIIALCYGNDSKPVSFRNKTQSRKNDGKTLNWRVRRHLGRQHSNEGNIRGREKANFHRVRASHQSECPLARWAHFWPRFPYGPINCKAS